MNMLLLWFAGLLLVLLAHFMRGRSCIGSGKIPAFSIFICNGAIKLELS